MYSCDGYFYGGQIPLFGLVKMLEKALIKMFSYTVRLQFL